MGTDAGQIFLDEDIDSIKAASDEKPVVFVYLSGTQSIPDNTITALSFGSENFDTHGFHSTSVNPTRITPNVPGIYRVTGTAYLAAATDYTLVRVSARKNGSVQAPAGQSGEDVNSIASWFFTTLLEFNGTTDYVEMVITQDNSANAARNAQASNPLITVFEMVYERGPS